MNDPTATSHLAGISPALFWGLLARYNQSAMAKHLDIDRDALAGFCRRHQIAKLSLFGSVLRDDFGPDSDIDVLVEFAPKARVGLIRLAGIQLELAALLGGRRVDMRTAEDLSRYFREDVVKSAEAVYAA